jgi:hypothetical protein
LPRDRAAANALHLSACRRIGRVLRSLRQSVFAATFRADLDEGGQFVDEVHFTYAADPLRSMLSLTSYLGTGEYREKYLGLRIPPTDVQPEQLEQTRTFAATLADRLFARDSAVPGQETV